MGQSNMPIAVGDIVTIISGFHKNESGEVLNINKKTGKIIVKGINCLLYTSPSPRDLSTSRMPSSA